MDAMQILPQLTDDEKQDYLDFEETFGTSGWKKIIKLAESDRETAITLGSSAQSWDENRIMYGRRLQIEALINYANNVENYFMNLAEERAEAQNAGPDYDPEDEENHE